MTDDDIMLMALDTGPLTQGPFKEWCKRFANLVAAHEREACAAMFDDRNVWDEEVGERIRARGNT
jgi:hypothetical protein